MFENEIAKLKKIGLNDSEAKVYISLLGNGMCSGYEASKISTVSRTKIYGVLEALVTKGFAVFSEDNGTNRYSAVPFREISERVKRNTENVLDELTDSFENIGNHADLENIWHIKGYKNIVAKAKDMIANSKESILIQIWEDDVEHFTDELKSAEEKGIRMGIVVFSEDENMELPLKKFYRHGFTEEKMQEMGGRWITVVSDKSEMIFGQLVNKHSSEVVWTESSPLVILASEWIKHDMYFYRCADILNKALRKTPEDEFADELREIREI